MKKNFNDCLDRVLQDEGGYTNDPSDSGGPTKYGITITDVRRYVNKNATSQDVRNLTVGQASTIYKSRYWDTLSCDNLASGVDYTAFDYGVNSGVGRPRKALQTFKSLKGTELIDAINNERTAFLKALAAKQTKDKKFLSGWLNRVQRVRNYSHYLSTNVKDNTTGPAFSIATILAGIYASMHYFEDHKWMAIGGISAAALIIGFIIHKLRNNNGS